MKTAFFLSETPGCVSTNRPVTTHYNWHTTCCGALDSLRRWRSWPSYWKNKIYIKPENTPLEENHLQVLCQSSGVYVFTQRNKGKITRYRYTRKLNYLLTYTYRGLDVTLPAGYPDPNRIEILDIYLHTATVEQKSHEHFWFTAS